MFSKENFYKTILYHYFYFKNIFYVRNYLRITSYTELELVFQNDYQSNEKKMETTLWISNYGLTYKLKIIHLVIN